MGQGQEINELLMKIDFDNMLKTGYDPIAWCIYELLKLGQMIPGPIWAEIRKIEKILFKIRAKKKKIESGDIIVTV